MELILKELNALREKTLVQEDNLKAKFPDQILSIHLERKEIHISNATDFKHDGKVIAWRLRGSEMYPLEASFTWEDWNIYSLHTYDQYTELTGKSITL